MCKIKKKRVNQSLFKEFSRGTSSFMNITSHIARVSTTQFDQKHTSENATYFK